MSAIHDTAAALLRQLPPELAHNTTLWAMAHGLGPRQSGTDDAILASNLWARSFSNPIGIAAGFDKNARALGGLMQLGLGFVEVGGVTPKPQRGNPRPRLFRLPRDRAVINRMGFNNDGLDSIQQRLAQRQAPANQILGINLAANTDSDDPVGDFALLVRTLAPLAGFLTIDISCPNTANGQVFLSPEPLRDLLDRLQDERRAVTPGQSVPPMLAKLAPDIDADALPPLIATLEAAAIDGIIICNSTTDRPGDLTDPNKAERGGLSGKPLFKRSTELLHRIYSLTGGNIPLIGVGGVASGGDAYAKIRAGASLVQLYTALVYAGPSLIVKIKRDLATLLYRDGFTSLTSAIGADHKQPN
ncbi:MAG: quinone-dependent dihydroorotate dehydrogenase [Alphaproteobacteria bacterium]